MKKDSFLNVLLTVVLFFVLRYAVAVMNAYFPSLSFLYGVDVWIFLFSLSILFEWNMRKVIK